MNSTYENTLHSLEATGNLRCIKPDFSQVADMVDMSSNDYLGLATEQSLVDEFFDSLPREKRLMTSSASRLLSARQDDYLNLERALSDLYGREVLLYNSGYHANTGSISALAVGNTLIVADKLVHASIIDGIVLSRCEFTRFRHNDLKHLRSILSQKASSYESVLVVTESVFSMDGDIANLAELVAIKKEFPNVMLYVDEAHGFGVFGERGLGVAERDGFIQNIDVIVGTFGKAGASSGAFVATSKVLKDYLINKSRSFIFSTSIAPINCAWTKFVVDKIVGMNGRREHLAKISKMLYDVVNPLNGNVVSESQIVPLVIGDSNATLAKSEQLKKLGFIALPIRTPTVPAGTERIRFSLNASISEATIKKLIEAINFGSTK